MRSPLVRKLECSGHLTENDCALLDKACEQVRQIGPHQDLIGEGDRPDAVRLILRGFACRYKVLSDGSRQNMALLIPGDFCDLHVAILGEMDHSIATLSACTVAHISQAAITDLTHNHPRITRAFWWSTLVDEGTLREWLVNLGQREATQRMAHLLCELLVRLRVVGLADETGYDLPLTQAELGETLGITSVHANRVLQVLREARMIKWNGGRVTIYNPDDLMDYCGFTPNYLHLREPQLHPAP